VFLEECASALVAAGCGRMVFGSVQGGDKAGVARERVEEKSGEEGRLESHVRDYHTINGLSRVHSNGESELLTGCCRRWTDR
jgi:hypothetical protein